MVRKGGSKNVSNISGVSKEGLIDGWEDGRQGKCGFPFKMPGKTCVSITKAIDKPSSSLGGDLGYFA